MAEPTNVLEALLAVSAAVDHIAKEKTAQAGGTYSYRGIEDVLEAVHDPFIRYKIVVVPQVVNAESVLHEIPRYNKAGEPIGPRSEYEARILVNYRVYGPGGPEDFIDCPIFTTSVDSSDKQTGKAMSYAYKNLMFQLLCIPTAAAEDNEATAPPRESVREPQSAPKQGHGKDSPRWQAVREKLTNMDAGNRMWIVDTFVSDGLFDKRPEGNFPNLPFTEEDMAHMERRMAHMERGLAKVEADPGWNQSEATDTLSPAHPQHAIDTICYALECQPNEIPDDLDVAFWYLAEHADADEIDWKAAAKALHITPTGVLKAAKEVAEVLGIPAPKRLDDEDSPIMGNLAIELRAFLIKDSMGDPFPTKERVSG